MNELTELTQEQIEDLKARIAEANAKADKPRVQVLDWLDDSVQTVIKE